jgi:hypothetical protein
MRIFVRTENGETNTLELDPFDKIETLISKLLNQSGLSCWDFFLRRLSLNGQFLENGYTVTDYNIRSNDTIVVVRAGYDIQDRIPASVL